MFQTRVEGWCGLLLLVLIVAWPVSARALSGPDSGEYSIKIVGNTRNSEHKLTKLALIISDQPVHNADAGAYSPIVLDVNDDPMYAPRQSSLKIYWDFGDGTPGVVVAGHGSVAHVYEEEGHYTISASARDHAGEFATATHEIEIANNDPASVMVAATVVDSAQNLVEFTATAEDASGDSELNYEWNFGDGAESASGVDLWRISHQFPAPGEYEVKLTVTDDDYPSGFGNHERNDGKVEKIRRVVVGEASEPGFTFIEDEVTLISDLTNRLEGTTNGIISASFKAGIRHFRGMYLAPIHTGTCRFMFTAWDDANLAYALGIIDLNGLPEEGARYSVSTPNFSIHLHPTGENYTTDKKTWMGRSAGGGMGGLAQAALEQAQGNRELTEDEEQAFEGELAKSGLEAGERIPDEIVPIPADSPFELDERVSFKAIGGNLTLDFIPGDRAVGEYTLNLRAGSGEFKGEVLDFQGSFDLDLVAARRDGVVSQQGCEPAPFEVKKIWPPVDTPHIRASRQPVRVTFTEDPDPNSIDDNNFQLTYVDTSEQNVPVASRILRDGKRVHLVPDAPLLPGVYYTAWIRTGSEGIRSAGGLTLEDSDQDGWFSWTFSTMVDMVAEPAAALQGSKRLFACDLYQSARNVPLIVGKPAAARVFAKWEKQAGVHPDHQVKQFQGEVFLLDRSHNELASTTHTFVRPDLWQQWGIDLRSMEHSAQITGIIPTSKMSDVLPVEIRVPTAPSMAMTPQYRAFCPIEIWGKRPSLSIDFVALPFDEWSAAPANMGDVMPLLQRIADRAVDYVWQLYPLADIQAGGVRVLPFKEGDIVPPKVLPGEETPVVCDSRCLLEGANPFNGFEDWLAAESTADIVVAFGPHDRLKGGYTGRDLRSGRGVVLTLASPDASVFSRYVFAVAHEIGHVFELISHIPNNSALSNAEAAANRTALESLREPTTEFEYRGIEGLRISRDGDRVWNKSYHEGNEEGTGGDYRLFPLMFPSTIPTNNAFISNHNYRKVQRLLDEL